MDEELLTILNEISKVTIEISDIYKKLVYYKTENWNEELFTSFCTKLASFKEKENELYSFFEDEPGYCISALENFNSARKDAPYTDKLCAERIIKRLNRIHATYLANNPDIVSNGIVEPDAEKYLTHEGFSEEEAISIILKSAIHIEKSLATALHNLQLQMIPQIRNNNIKNLYIERMFNVALGTGGKFEDSLLSRNFSFLSNTLAQEMALLSLNDEQRQVLVNFLISKNLKECISDIMATTDPEELDGLFIRFRANIIHLNIQELEMYKKSIYLASLLINYDPKYLIDEIDNIINLRNKSKGKDLK